MDQTTMLEETAAAVPAEDQSLPVEDGGDSATASDADDMPPLETIKEELSAPPHGKKIRGVAAEGDSEPEAEEEESKDGWTDILNNGDLRKKIITPAIGPGRPARGDKVTLRLVTRIYEGPDGEGGVPGDVTGEPIPGETFDRFELVVGDNDLYQGLDLMIPLMDKGEKSRLLIKPRFGYGPTGNKAVGIPADAMLDLEVEILEVNRYDNSPLAGNPLGGNDPEPGEPNPVVTHEQLPDRLRIGNYKKGRGNFWFERGEYGSAIQCYRGAIKFLDASEEELALADRAKSGKLVEQSADVTDKLREIEDLIDKRAQTYNNLAAAQLKTGSFDDALRSVENSLLLRPENVKALYRRAKIHTEKGNIEEAIADLKTATRIDPSSEAIALELDRLSKVLARQLKEQKNMYRRMMNFKDDESGGGSSSSKSNDGDNGAANSGSAAVNSNSKSDDAKSSTTPNSTSTKSWYPFSKMVTISAIGALAAAILIPSLYVYFK